MKNPSWLNLVVICIILLGIVAAVVSSICNTQALQMVTNLAIILTLAVLIIYAYHTYILAKDTCTPSASFALGPYQSNPYHFFFYLRTTASCHSIAGAT